MPNPKEEKQLRENLFKSFLGEKPFANGLIACGDKINVEYKKPLGLTEEQAMLAVLGAIMDEKVLEQTACASSASPKQSTYQWIPVHMIRDFPNHDEERSINYHDAINDGRRNVASAFAAFEKGDKTEVFKLIERASKCITNEFITRHVGGELWQNTNAAMHLVKAASTTPEMKQLTGFDSLMEDFFDEKQKISDLYDATQVLEDGPEKQANNQLLKKYDKEIADAAYSNVEDERLDEIMPINPDSELPDYKLLMNEEYADNLYNGKREYIRTHKFGANEAEKAQGEREWNEYKETLYEKNKKTIEKALEFRETFEEKIEKVAKENGLNNYKIVNKESFANRDHGVFARALAKPLYLIEPTSGKILRLSTLDKLDIKAEFVDKLPHDAGRDTRDLGNLYSNAALQSLKDSEKYREEIEDCENEEVIAAFNNLKDALGSHFENFDEVAKDDIIAFAGAFNESLAGLDEKVQKRLKQFTQGIDKNFSEAKTNSKEYHDNIRDYRINTHPIDNESVIKNSNEYTASMELLNLANSEKPVGNRSTEAELHFGKFLGKFDDDANKALKDLYDLTKTLYTRDEDGNYPKFDSEIQKNLLNAYHKVNATLSKDFESPVMKHNASQIKTMLGRDIGTLTGIAPNGDKSLADEIGTSNVIRVDTKGKKLDHVGARSNRREAMEINKDGKPVQGFFTKEKTFSRKNIQPQLDSIKEYVLESKHPELLDLVMFCYEQTYLNIGNETQDVIGAVRKYYETNTYNGKTATNDIIEGAKLFVGEVEDNISIEDKLHLDSILNVKYQYGKFTIDANEDSNITDRNIAMSKVATLLNVPNLLARAERMEIDDGENIYSGIFMEKAVGKDFKHIMPEDAEKFENPLDDPGFKKQVADMQILDFVCQNIDRHRENFFLQFSEDGKKIVGVQGIDNDLSFGRILQGDREAIGDAANLFAQINVVSESMKESLFAINGETLKNALSDTGLTPDEIEAAAGRLEKVKNAITQKKIEVLTDEDFKKRSFESFKTEGVRTGTMFNRIALAFEEHFKESLQRNKEDALENAGKKLKFEKLNEMGGISPAQFEKDSVKANDYLAKIAASQKSIWGKGSAEFRNLEEAMKAYKETLDAFPKDPSDEDYRKMQAMLEGVSEAAKIYGDSKANVKHPNRRMRDRLELAKNIKETFDGRLKEFKDGLHKRDEIAVEEMNAKFKATANKLSNFDGMAFDKKSEYLKLGMNENVAEMQSNAFVAEQMFKAMGEGKIPLDHLAKKELVAKMVLNDLILRERLSMNGGKAVEGEGFKDYKMGQFENMIANGQGKLLLDAIGNLNVVENASKNMTIEDAKKLAVSGGVGEISNNVLNTITTGVNLVKGAPANENVVEQEQPVIDI